MIVFSFYSHFTHWFKKDHFGFNHLVCPSVPLFCYTCVFPAISPLDCIRFPLRCPPGQVCLSSRAVGEKGEGASCHWKQNSNESKLRKRTEKDVSLPSSRWVGVVDFFSFSFCESLPNWCFHWTLLWLSGDFRVVLYEKSCILPSLCGVTGEKYTMGLNFTFTNECCNTHLCNRAATPTTSYWTAALLTLLISYSVWWIKQWR